jgi:hypothetical protein
MRLVTAVVTLVIGWSAEAAQAQSLLLGGRIGRSSAMQHLNEPEFDYSRRLGVSAGVAATFELRSWFALQMEGLYAEKGARLDASYEMRVDYLEFPLLARVASPVAFHGFRPFLDGGLAPSFELRCSGYSSAFYLASIVAGPSQRVPLNCDYQRKRHADRGRVLGGGVLFNRGRMQWSGELRRTRGQDISGYRCCDLRNDVTSILIGASRRLR